MQLSSCRWLVLLEEFFDACREGKADNVVAAPDDEEGATVFIKSQDIALFKCRRKKSLFGLRGTTARSPAAL